MAIIIIIIIIIDICICSTVYALYALYMLVSYSTIVIVTFAIWAPTTYGPLHSGQSHGAEQGEATACHVLKAILTHRSSTHFDRFRSISRPF